MVDALREEAGVETIPARGLVSVNGGARGNAGHQNRERGILGLRDGRDGTAAALAQHDDDTALAGLVLGLATVDPVFLPVLGSDVAAEIGAVDLDLAGGGVGRRVGADGLTELVGEHESRLVLNVQVAGELQGAVALGAVHEDRNGEQIGADRQLAAGEDGPRRNGELVLTGLALPKLAGGDEAVGEAAAAGANRIAARVAPADHAEGVVGFLGGHAGDLRQGERPGRPREEKMLSHVASAFRCWQR